STLANLAVFTYALGHRSHSEAMTMTFATLVVIQFVNAYNFRSDRRSLFSRPFANHWLNAAIAWELLLLGLVIYLPVLQSPFGTFGLTLDDWLIVAAASASIIPVIEAAKWMERRGWFGAVE
ncbi:MAG TPA: cation-translocating P-type ATPase C-terminal domain-containing protein, partial [Pyrinomonadaceae bacterium]|nr:cation-translocating P-type ATPase C-terminal domain-containing protein [Pyrinomonadaceae bacterium]